MSYNYIIILCLLLIIVGCANISPINNEYVTYDDDGMLLIEGKRTFILGSYHLPKSEQPYQELAEAGFNLLRVSADTAALDQAGEAGLFGWISVGTIDPKNREESANKLREKINRFKDHPALLIWESVDEPAWTWLKAGSRIPPEPLIEGYNLVKSIDPKHLMYMNQAPVNLRSTLRRYNAATDIIACDVYPVIAPNTPPMFALFPDGYQGDLLNTYISQVGQYTEKMRWVAEGKRPLFMVLQGFAWETLRNENRNDSLILYPTREESRFMAYQAIIQGATGINYWGHSHTPQPSPFWSDLKSVVSELASIKEVLAAPAKDMHIVKFYEEMGHSIDRGVEVIIKKAHGTYYLITVNGDKNPVKVRIAGFGRDDFAEVLFENRTIDIVNRELIDSYKPFEVHIYKLRNH